MIHLLEPVGNLIPPFAFSRGQQPNKTLQLTPSRHAFLFTTDLPFFATRYRTSTRARGS
jgi:hypothetical protein